MKSSPDKPINLSALHKKAAFLLLDWFSENGSQFPWRNNPSPYGVFIAEMLLKRTTATAVKRVYLQFLDQFPGLPELANAGERELESSLSTLGLQRQRAKSMKAAAEWCIRVEKGEVPNDLAKLAAIPGIGEYSAAAIFSFAFGQRMTIVDSNVERFISRMFVGDLPERPSRSEIESKLKPMLPVTRHREFNYALLDLGRNICRYAHPLCRNCPLFVVCQYPVEVGSKRKAERSRDCDESTGEVVRRLRQVQGKSLQQLALQAGVSKLTIIRIESDKSRPRFETLKKISSALDVDPHELARGS